MHVSIKWLETTHNACLFIVHQLCVALVHAKQPNIYPSPFLSGSLFWPLHLVMKKSRANWGCDFPFYPESWLKQKDLLLTGSCLVWECTPWGYPGFVLIEAEAFESNQEHWLFGGEKKDVWERKLNKIKQIKSKSANDLQHKTPKFHIIFDRKIKPPQALQK